MSFVGWGYPSFWRDGSKTRLLYEANFNHSYLPVQLVAESAEDVHFQLTDTTQSTTIDSFHERDQKSTTPSYTEVL